MIVMVPESITSMTLHVDATLSSLASYLSIFLFFRCDEPKAFIIVVWLRADVMTHIHVASNIIISFTVGKHIRLREEEKKYECYSIQ